MRDLSNPDINLTASDRFVADWLVETRVRLDEEELVRRQFEHEQVLRMLALRGRLFPEMDPDQGYPVRRHREPGEDDE